LVHDGWSKERAYFMGVKPGGAIPGYQFALYKRIPTEFIKENAI
jgi:hypothetical protein